MSSTFATEQPLISSTFTTTPRFLFGKPVYRVGKMVVFENKKRRVHRSLNGIEYFKIKGAWQFATDTRVWQSTSLIKSCMWVDYSMNKPDQYFNFVLKQRRQKGGNKKYDEKACIDIAFSRTWRLVKGKETYVVELYKPLKHVSTPEPKSHIPTPTLHTPTPTLHIPTPTLHIPTSSPFEAVYTCINQANKHIQTLAGQVERLAQTVETIQCNPKTHTPPTPEEPEPKKARTIPDALISNIIMMSRPTYPYMEKLDFAFFLMRDYAEDFDGDFSAGRAFWLRLIREERDAPTMADVVEAEGECCYKSWAGVGCSCTDYPYY